MANSNADEEVMDTRVGFIGSWERDTCKKKHVFEQ